MGLNRNEYSELSDEELLHRFYADGNNRWLGILLPRFSLLIFGVCMKYLKNEEDAKDAVQQIFLKIIDQLHKYDVSNFKSWIYMVAKNHCLMKLRDQKQNRVEWNETIQPVEEFFELRQRNLQREALLRSLYESMEKLKPEQQLCIRYFYLDKKSYAEISELTGFTLLQVKSYLQNGKRKLELLMKDYHSQNIS